MKPSQLLDLLNTEMAAVLSDIILDTLGPGLSIKEGGCHLCLAQNKNACVCVCVHVYYLNNF